jgi:hypothetical protein
MVGQACGYHQWAAAILKTSADSRKNGFLGTLSTHDFMVIYAEAYGTGLCIVFEAYCRLLFKG